eukprot:10575401-Karenia_brevis.AAC.1
MGSLYFAIPGRGVTNEVAPKQRVRSEDRFAFGQTMDVCWAEIQGENTLHQTLSSAPKIRAEVVHQAWEEIFDEYGTKMALILSWKLVNLGNINLGGLDKPTWGTNV